MKTLLVGFDSAWSANNHGAIVAALRDDDGTYQELTIPERVNFSDATMRIHEWQAQYTPDSTLILIDQPTIVENVAGCRPVEYAVSPSASWRNGGMQPASMGRAELFGKDAPIRQFLKAFNSPRQAERLGASQVVETYPVLTIIAREWKFDESSQARRKNLLRLPNYNPAKRLNFHQPDWRDLCDYVASDITQFGLEGTAAWIRDRGQQPLKPKKCDQDCLDACICLLVALQLAEAKPCLMVGSPESGCITVPYNESLRQEISESCEAKIRSPDSSEALREDLRKLRFEMVNEPE